MSHSTVIYCAADFESAQGGPLNVALITPESGWVYAEVIDYSTEKLDQKALSEIVPRLMKVPRARFVHSDALQTEIAEFIEGLETRRIEVVTIGAADPRIQKLLRMAASQASTPSIPCFRTADIDERRFSTFLRHCGGGERTAGHPLVQVTGAALCDLARTVPTRFGDASIHHFELLMGSKNAGSYRAWARAQEREWLEFKPNLDKPRSLA